MGARLEHLLFARRRLVIAAFAIATLAMAWLAAGLPRRCRLHQAGAARARVHAHLRRVPRRVRRRGSGDHCAHRARGRHVHARVLRGAARGDRRDLLPARGGPHPGLLHPHTERALHRGGGGTASPPATCCRRTSSRNEAGFARVRENAIKAGVVGRLVANDWSGAIVSAKLQEFHPNTGERLDYMEVADELERIRREADADWNPDVYVDVHVIGFAKIVGDITAGAIRVMAFFGIALLVTALFVYAYTRSLRLTLPPLACSIIAVVWQLGGVTALGSGVDPMSILVPFLVFAIGVSHGVQMVSSVRAEVAGGASGLDAARASFRRLLLPGTVALASDSVGFITIAFIEVQVIQEIAVTASLGVRRHHPHQPGVAAGTPLLLRSGRGGAARGARSRRRLAAALVADCGGGAPGAGRGDDRRGGRAAGGGGAIRARGPGGGRAPRCAGAARGLRVQQRLGRHHRSIPDRRGRAHSNRGDGGGRLHRLRGDADPGRIRMAHAQRGGRAVRSRTRRCRPQHQRELERREPQVADPAAQPVHAGAGGVPGADEQRTAQPRLQRDAGVDLHARPQGGDDRTHRRRRQGVQRFKRQRAHRVPARLRQRRGDGRDQRGGGSVAVSHHRLRLRGGHRVVPGLLPLARGDDPASLRPWR